MSQMERKVERIIVTIPSGSARSGVVNFGPFAGGVLFMGSAWTAAELAFEVTATGEGGFLPLYRENALVSMAVAVDRAEIIPEGVFPMRTVRLLSHDGAGTPVNQGADREIILLLKS